MGGSRANRASDPAETVREDSGDADLLPMTAAQQGMYFECLRRDSPDYIVSVDLLVDATPGDRLRAAAARIVQEQPALRATVSVERSGVSYRVARHAEPDVTVHDLRDDADADAAADTVAAALIRAPFDLQGGPLVRIAQCRLGDADRVIIACHHLVADGQSVGSLAAQLVALALDDDRDPDALPGAEDVGFARYQERRSRPLPAKQSARREAYWRGALARQDAPDLGHWLLPERGADDAEDLGREVRMPIDAGLHGRIREAAMAVEVSEHTVYLSVFGVLLARYADATAVSVAVPFTDRPGIEEAESFGCFLTTAPIRLDADRTHTVRAMLESASGEILGAWRNIGYPVAELLSEHPALAGVFDITFIQDTHPSLPGGVRTLRRPEMAPFPGRFAVTVEHHDGGAQLILQYKPGALLESEVRRFGERFVALLEQLPTSLDSSIGELPMSAPSEEGPLRAQLADTHRFDAEPTDLGRLFLEKTRSAPARTAWRDAHRAYSNAWAHDSAVVIQRLLLDTTGGASRPVGVQLPRGVELLACVYGVLLAGCHYVPFSEDEPAQRVRQMSDDAGIEVVITTSESDLDFGEGVTRIDVDRLDEFHALRHDERVETQEVAAEIDVDVDALAYIEYTSGTTGSPKGVMIRHRNVHNTALDLESAYPLRRDDSHLLKTAFTFDIFGTEIYGWLVGQGDLVVLPIGAEADPLALAEAVRASGITHLNISPTMLRLLLDAVVRAGSQDALASLRHVFSGGEALTHDIVERFSALELPCTLENVYGPTEATMWATRSTVRRDDRHPAVPIGRPLNDYRVYVLGADDALLGAGLPGELCITGAGVAAGYLDREDLTAQAFIANPFFDEATDDDTMRRMYRTGDLGYLREDGQFAFLRRIDRQVKVAGVRIELVEIEHAMRDVDPIVEAAVVVDRNASGTDRIVAFFRADRPVGPPELRQALTASLPRTSIPSLFVQLPGIPTSAAGKIDRRALLASLHERGDASASTAGAASPAGTDSAAPPVTGRTAPTAPATDPGGHGAADAATASDVLRLRSIWQAVLGIDEGMTADPGASFFDVGGNSLSLVRLQFAIADEFGRDLSITDLLRAASIGDQARLLASVAGGTPADDPVATTPSAPESPLASSPPRSADVAIIGIGVQAPGSVDVQEFWQHLRAGDETITFYDDDELRLLGVTETDLRDPHYVKASGRLDGIGGFDSALFAIPPAEADVTSPQLRLLYECFWQACEDAGYDPTDLPGRVGVFAGGSDDFEWYRRALGEDSAFGSAYQNFTLATNHFLSTRLSYRFDLTGPAYSALAGCSTSLLTVHLAVQSLRLGECELAVAGGVTLELPNEGGYRFVDGMMLSPDGHCRPFDADANGTVFSNGAALLLLKPLAAAQRDGDPVYAVIAGSATGNDGRRKLSYTAPSEDGQFDTIRAAYRDAGIDPASVSFVEAHGTGTLLGDPVEVASLSRAFAEAAPGSIALGSVKGNVGHTDTAAGAMGLAKVALSLHDRYLPGTCNFTQPNPHIDFATTPFAVSAVGAPLPGGTLRAGINAFGVGGTNVHMILETDPSSPTADGGRADRAGGGADPGSTYELLQFSASSPTSVAATADRVLRHLAADDAVALADAAHTLRVGRAASAHRTAVVVDARGSRDAGSWSARALAARAPALRGGRTAFLFSGQGNQHVEMGRGLHRDPGAIGRVFRHWTDEIIGMLDDGDAAEYREIMAGDGADGRIDRTEWSQLAIFTTQFATAKVLESFGVRPDVLVGHSVGELTAAALAGVWSLGDAVRLVRRRGLIMQRQEPGIMLAVAAAAERVREVVVGLDDVWISLDNSAQRCVLGMAESAFPAVVDRLEAAGVAGSRLHTRQAFHTPMMAEAGLAFEDEVRAVPTRDPRIPIISNVSGAFVASGEMTEPRYWSDHITGQVRFADSLRALLSDEWLGGAPLHGVELGPGRSLTSFALHEPSRTDRHVFVNALRHPVEEVADDAHLLATLGTLWSSGLEIDWRTHTTGRRIRLPGTAMDKLPLGGPSAIDRPAATASRAPDVPVPARSESRSPSRTTVAPRTAGPRAGADGTLDAVRDAFRSVLGYATVERDDDFFALGGDSLKATVLVSRLAVVLGAPVTVADVFAAPTPGELATRLSLGAAPTGAASDVAGGDAAAVALRRTADAADHPTSPSQRRMHLAARLRPAALVYNMPSATHLDGPLDPGRVRVALARLVERHEPLRTVIVRRGDEIRQRVQDAGDVDLPLVLSADEGPGPIRVDELVARFVRPFDLESGPLFRMEIVTHAHGGSTLLFDIHHIVADAVSVEILTRDFGLLYEGELAQLPLQYRDYAAHLALESTDRATREAGHDVVALLRDAPTGEALVRDRPRHGGEARAERVRLRLDRGRSAAIAACAEQHRATPFMVVLAVWGAVLGRTADRDDLLIGVPVSGRTLADTTEMVGMFVNMMPVRLRPSHDLGVADYLADCRDAVLTALAHQDVPFERLVEALRPDREVGRHPLVDVSIDYHNVDHHDLSIDGVVARPIDLVPLGVGMDLVVTCLESDEGLTLDLDYAADLFDRTTIERLAQRFERLLSQVVGTTEPTTALGMLSRDADADADADADDAAVGTGIRSEPFAAIHVQFAERARLAPDDVAVIDADGRPIGYAELDALVNAQAARLVAAGLRVGERVVLLAERDATLVVAQLAILRAGGVYVALDPSHPRERQERILDDVAPRFGYAPHGREPARPIPILFDLADCRSRRLEAFDAPEIGADDLAYVVYTSGSTGTPKGVAVRHGGIANLQRDHARRGMFAPGDTVIALADPTFDIVVFETLLPLASGATVHMCPAADVKDGSAIARRITEHGVTHIQVPVSKMAALCGNARFRASLPGLRSIVCGGEHFAETLLELLQASTDARVFNMYGPSETTVTATVKEFAPGDDVTIGTAIDGVEVLVVGEDGAIHGAGFVGELVIVGAGLAAGYTNNPEQQARAFTELPALPGVRVYRTGDRGMRRADGEIVLRGRADHQVKHHGNRIELGEIEVVAMAVDGVQYAVADVVRDELVLCCVGADDPGSRTALSRALVRSLPGTMVPSRIEWMRELPTLPNAKVDRRALHAILSDRPAGSARPPGAGPSGGIAATTATEGSEVTLDVILRAWREVLERPVDAGDNFFDVGGNSYKLMLVHNRLTESIRHDIPLVTLFEFPTPARLAAALDRGAGARPGSGSTADDAGPREEPITLDDLEGLGDWTREWPVPQARDDDRREPPGPDRRIAVIGMAGVFPGADGVEEFLDNRADGVVSITRFTRDEMLAAGIDPKTIDHRHYVNARGHVSADAFDADFFGYSARDAESMDPQARLLHETAWHALEDGGCSPADFDGRIGLFAGSGTNFAWMAGLLGRQNDSVGVFEALTMNEKDFLATRVAYKLDLTGPAVTVQTACSTSLVAIHEAVQCLRRGEAEMALAGGVALNFPRSEGYQWQEGMIFSEDGVCRPFSEDANGTVPGQGCGVVLLKPLVQALADGDPIRAVISGTAMNNDGGDKVGYAAPSVGGQAKVIRAAVADAAIDPADVGYVETHGTGTKLGDPVEVAALAEVYGRGATRPALGAAKANIGHLDAAAGVAGFISAVGVLSRGTVPPMANFTRLNEQFGEAAPFSVPTAAFAPAGGVRAAAVSSFGIGGTNVHVVLEAAPRAVDAEESAGMRGSAHVGPSLLPVSARTGDALDRMRAALDAHVGQLSDGGRLPDASHTLAHGRAEFDVRAVAIAEAGTPLVWFDADAPSLAFDAADSTVLRVAPHLVTAGDVASDGLETELRTALAAELQPFDERLRSALRSELSGSAPESGPDEPGAGSTAAGRIAQLVIRVVLLRVVGMGGLHAPADRDTLLRVAAARVRGELSAKDALVALRSGALSDGLGGTTGAQAASPGGAATTLVGPEIDAGAVRLVLSSAWVRGADVPRARFSAAGRRVSLPGYAFERRAMRSDIRLDDLLVAAPVDAAEADPAALAVDAGGAAVGSEADIVEVIRMVWAEVLGDTPLADADFLLSGGDSLSAVHFCSRLEAVSGVVLTVGDVFLDTSLPGIAATAVAKAGSAGGRAAAIRAVRRHAPSAGRRTAPASPAQRRIYAACMLRENTSAYNLGLSYRVDGGFDAERFRSALHTLVERHEQLRTSFELDGGELVQRLHADVPEFVEVVEVTEEAAEARVVGEPEPFDLGRAPLIRADVLRVGSELHYLRLDLHHIVGDQHSLAVLAEELALALGGEPMPALGAPYTDHSSEILEHERAGDHAADVAHFAAQLADDLPPLQLPADHGVPDAATFAGARHHLVCRVPRSLVVELARTSGATPYAVFLAAFTRVLAVWSGQREFVIGAAMSGRTPATSATVGMFVNTVPLRLDADSALTPREAVAAARDTALGALAHQHVPVDLLLAALGIPAGGEANALFDVLLNFVSVGTEAWELDGARAEPLAPRDLESRYALSLSVSEHAADFAIDIEYRTEMFEASTIGRLAGHLDELLSEMVLRPDDRMVDLLLETPVERDRRRAALTAPGPAVDETLVDRMGASFAAHAELPALRWREEQWSYAEVDRITQTLAGGLQAAGVDRGAVVMVLLERGPWQLFARLALMRCGAIEVPLDPGGPVDRIAHTLQDSGAMLVLVDDLAAVEWPDGVTAVTPTGLEGAYHAPRGLGPDSPLIMIYTSGTTGAPKGTIVTHRGMLSTCTGNGYTDYRPGMRVSHLTGNTFDPSLLDVYSALLAGATVVMGGQEANMDMRVLGEFLRTERIDAGVLITAVFHLLMAEDPRAIAGMSALYVGGEEMRTWAAKRAFDVLGAGRIFNLYGPTEASCTTTFFRVDDEPLDDRMPIGRPAGNRELFILHPDGTDVPRGVPGELCIAGPSVSLGYHHRPELTIEKFVPAATVASDGDAGERLYRTGDLVVLDDHDDLVFLRRIDRQIKHAGHRIELSEIEGALKAVVGVTEAVVVHSLQGSNSRLTAFYSGESAPGEDELRPALLERLPRQLVPQALVRVHELPLTRHGKIDRARLAERVESHVGPAPDAPTGDGAAERILDAMRAVLPGAPLGLDEDFFHAGAQSIQAIAAVQRLRAAGLELEVSDLYRHPSALALAASLAARRPATATAGSARELTPRPVAVEQLDLIVARAIAASGSAALALALGDAEYSFPRGSAARRHQATGAATGGFLQRVEGADVDTLLRALEEVMCRHEVLRVRMRGDRFEVMPETNARGIAALVQVHDLRSVEAAQVDQCVDRLAHGMQRAPFGDGLLWRCTVLRDADGFRLVWAFHHAIFDGSSSAILRDEIRQLVRGESLPEAPRFSRFLEHVDSSRDWRAELQDFDLRGWLDMNRTVTDDLRSRAEQGRSRHRFPYAEANPLESALAAIHAEFASGAGTDPVAVGFVNDCRRWDGADYSGCVGEFLDVVPVLLGGGVDDARTSDRLTRTLDRGVHYTHSLADGTPDEGVDGPDTPLLRELRDAYGADGGRLRLLLVNFQGFIAPEDVPSADSSDPDPAPLALAQVNAWYDDEFVHLDIHVDASPDEAVIGS